ncbi:MAG: metallophosphoesterase family protein [Anaerolineae bacterium]
MFKFMHLADLHLGCEQYGLRERTQDIARACKRAAEAAVSEEVQFVLIAGDVFHNRSISPDTLLTAVSILSLLREADIPVVAVAGNHDRGWRSESLNWLSLLHNLGYLICLDVTVDRGSLQLNPPDSEHPSYIDIGEARIVGLPYFGTGLPRLLGQLPERLPALERKYTILLAHTGLEGEMPGFSQPVRQEHLEPLRPYVDYLALGHLHKPFERLDWIYNPGSLEALGVDEVQFAGGWYLVEAKPNSAGEWQHQAKLVPCKRREFRRLPPLEVGLYDTPDALQRAVEKLAENHLDLLGKQPLLELTLKGNLRFANSSLDLNRLSQVLEEKLQPLKVLVRNFALPPEVPAIIDEDIPRSEIEMRVLQQAVAADARYAPHQDTLSSLAKELKDMVLARTAEEEVFAKVLSIVAELGLVERT